MTDKRHDFHEVFLASGDGANLGVVKNKRLAWKRVVEKLVTPTVDQSITFAEYQALDDQAKGRKKTTAFITGGHFKDGKRKLENISSRSLIMLDVDAATPDQIEWVKDGLSDALRFRFVAHTTRSHCREKPKYRFVFPLYRRVNYLEFHAIARVLASMLFETSDESMAAVDPVSFRMAQLMYLPTISKGQDWDAIDNPGALLHPDEFLEGLGFDWTDAALLPYDPARGVGKATDPSAKAELPTDKPGIIGAFCRAYDVEDAIAEFLPDVYAEGDAAWSKPRYTYLGGSGVNGAIVEDDGLFLYSHHGTDPCAERLVHSFDLVRIHKFGHLDKDVREGTSPTQYPSYRKMVEFAERQPTVVAERTAGVADKFDFGFEDDDEAPIEPKAAPRVEVADEDEPDIASMFDEAEDDDLLGDEPVPAKKKTDKGWIGRLDVSEKGEIKSTVHNTALILTNDKRVCRSIEYNEHTHDITIRRPLRLEKLGIPTMPVPEDGYGRSWQDHDDTPIRVLMEAPSRLGGYGFKPSKMDVIEGVSSSAMASRYHPIREYLKGCVWDGVERLERLFIDHLGSPDNAYTREAARTVMVASVARVFEPGAKFDCVPILGGAQGKRKSTFVRVLGRDRWFRELSAQFENTGRMVESMQGGWHCEIGELSGFARNEIETIKQFIAAVKDQYRLAYARRVGTFPRQVVFWGTTNKKEYLKDPTGNRRFWPLDVNVAEIDIDKLEREIDQIYAEALHVYRAMRKAQPHGSLFLNLRSAEAKAIASGEQQSRMVETVDDALVEEIEAWLATPCTKEEAETPGSVTFESDDEDLGLRNTVTAGDVFRCLMGGRSPLRFHDQVTISNALAKLPGWGRPANNSRKFRRGKHSHLGYIRSGVFERQGYWSELVGEALDEEDAALLG